MPTLRMHRSRGARFSVQRRHSCRRSRGLLIATLFVTALHAQRAQLPRKGRQPETAPTPPADPVRKLPRKTAVTIATRPTPRPPLTPDAPLSEDRVRRLIHG